jgi:hypothetical protein
MSNNTDTTAPTSPPTKGEIPNPCQTQLDLASTCVAADPLTCSCQPSPFPEAFPKTVNDAYKTTMAFYQPEEDGFCDKANSNVCGVTDTQVCCCTEEVKAYVECSYQNDLNLKFGVVECNYACGGAAGGDGDTAGGLSMMMMAIIGAGILLLCCCCGCFCWRRRRLRRQQVSKDVRRYLSVKRRGDIH